MVHVWMTGEERLKCKWKTRTLSSNSWETPSASLRFPAGQGGSNGTRGQEEAFNPARPACYQETCWGACHQAGCRKRETQRIWCPVPIDARACPEEWTSANRKPFIPCSSTVPMATNNFPCSSTSPSFSSNKLSIWIQSTLGRNVGW